jgi:hypothetical protein
MLDIVMADNLGTQRLEHNTLGANAMQLLGRYSDIGLYVHVLSVWLCDNRTGTCMLSILPPAYTPFIEPRSSIHSEPFSSEPSVEELQASLRLVKRNHMSRGMDLHEGEVAI